MTGLLYNLIIKMAGTEEEAADGLAKALRMEVVKDERSAGNEEGGGTLRALEALEFLTQESEPSGTTLVGARNGFNELSRLAMLWTVWQLPRLVEKKFRSMPVSIESKPRPRRPAVPHSPQHCQAAQLVEPITDINEHCSARMSFLSEELKGSQFPLSLPSFVLLLATPVFLKFHLLRVLPKCGVKALCWLLLCSCRLFVKVKKT